MKTSSDVNALHSYMFGLFAAALCSARITRIAQSEMYRSPSAKMMPRCGPPQPQAVMELEGRAVKR